MSWINCVLKTVTGDRPVLIAGPTASGKSALALEIADRFGGTIINADALQIYSDWRILTARPSLEDESKAPHALYGYVPGTQGYSVGHWLRDVTPLLEKPCPIIVGGTGLNFAALTDGLADIPQVPIDLRELAESLPLEELVSQLDAKTAARIDQANPMRVQRAWSVLHSTGRGLADWQDDTPPAVLPLRDTQAFVISGDVDWLNARIERRFDLMLETGLIDEARENAKSWHLDLPSAKAIGAAEVIEYARGTSTLDDVREAVVIQSRQYAKRQRSWFRGRMKAWTWIKPDV